MKHDEPKSDHFVEPNKKGVPSALPAVPCSKSIRVKMKIQVVEYHTVVREVDAEEFADARDNGDLVSWLDRKFKDEDISDSDDYTESFEVKECEEL